MQKVRNNYTWRLRMRGSVGSRIVRVFALVIFAILSIYSVEAEAADTSPALFKPAALVNGDSICPAVLKSTQTAFTAGLSWDSLADGIGTGDDGLEALEIGDPNMEAANEPAVPSVVNPDVKRVLFVTVGAAKVFIRLETAEFCGGACEARRALLSANSNFSDVRQTPPSEADNSTPYAPTWALLKGSAESYYVAGIVNKHVRVYRIVAPSKFRLACDILAAPDDSILSTSSNPIARAVSSSLHDFELALAAITGETNGDCGSMRTPARWNAAVHEALLEIVYRPTSSDWSPRQTDSENSFGDYQRNIKILESWALGGVYEYRAFARYQEQFGSAARQLTGFYTSVFHMPVTRAVALAQRNLAAAVSRGMGFYMYEPPFRSDVERRFRLGILDHLPREQLESIAAEAWPQGVPADEENIVALATSYPSALRALLDRGANPNVRNAFGKTPLMYAAQFNQLQSVDLLLQHGADPNAATIWPQDRCNYQLKTSRLTPLHYAVRYASTSVVRSLLSKGAVTFCKTETEYGGIDGYPADWLARYTDPSAAERNQNIPATEIPELQRLLRVPDDAERAKLADYLAHQAESDYARQDLDSAYRKLKQALAANGTNERASNDLPLVALKTGHLGEALEATEAIIRSHTSPGTLAAAWFNRGLACEQAGHPIGYDGKYFCMDSGVHPFLESWKAEPTPSRAAKLRNVLEHGVPWVCKITIDKRQQLYYFSASRYESDDHRHSSYRIYVLHPSDQSIDPLSILASIEPRRAPVEPDTAKTISPIEIERDDLGQVTITVLEWQYLSPQPIVIYGQYCKPIQ